MGSGGLVGRIDEVGFSKRGWGDDVVGHMLLMIYGCCIAKVYGVSHFRKMFAGGLDMKRCYDGWCVKDER